MKLIKDFRWHFCWVIILVIVTSCNNNPSSSAPDLNKEKQQIISLLDSFNAAAARADYDNYFGYYTDDATFIGTDAKENWDKKAFMAWAKPAFDKGKAWDFTAVERNIFFDSTGRLAWFDELLSTQMKLCRGSGVLVKKGNDWKVQQYVLSMTFPNELIDTIVALKGPIEDSVLKTRGSR
ncbi:nuclear transport factor 2 family protein [Pollutibacter soli]|uniref:nuclear transport factor 2 family protein n=1 Tax=Pollutibacter soli TaxID=3034157 RepID=UPI0030137E43